MALSAPTMKGASRIGGSFTGAIVFYSWTGGSYPFDLFIERRMDGGAWTQIASTGAATTQYNDMAVSENHRYEYRARVHNVSPQEEYSAYSSVSNAIRFKPDAPSGLTAVFAGANTVNLSWVDTSGSESGVEVERSDDGATWSNVAVISGQNQTTYTDSAAPAGNPRYRIRYYSSDKTSTDGTTWTNVTLYGSYSEPVTVATLAQPNPPTVLSPADGAVLNMPASVVFEWQHNPTDGTAQTQATVAISTNGGSTWTETTLTQSAQSWTCNTSSYTAGTSLSFRVKTKGTYATASDWSSVRTINLKQAPSVAISDPTGTDGGTISDVPVRVGFAYTDNSGSFASASIIIADSDGTAIYKNLSPEWVVAGTQYYYDIPVLDLLPTNNSTYTLTVTAVSDSGLSTIENRVFATSYAEPNPPEFTYTIDPLNASVTATVNEGTGGSLIGTESVGLFRIDPDGAQVPIAPSMPKGSTVIDRLPPLDQPVTYRAVAYTVNGLTSQTLTAVTVPSEGYSYFNWGVGDIECARFAMDLAWTKSISPKRALYEVVGLRDPVLRTTNRRTKTFTASGVVWWDDDAPLEALQDVPERVWFREPAGNCSPVALTVDLTYPKGVPTTAVQISMTQVSEV